MYGMLLGNVEGNGSRIACWCAWPVLNYPIAESTDTSYNLTSLQYKSEPPTWIVK